MLRVKTIYDVTTTDSETQQYLTIVSFSLSLKANFNTKLHIFVYFETKHLKILIFQHSFHFQ